MMGSVRPFGMACLLAGAWAGTASAAATGGRQAVFDAAQAAFEKNDWAAAARGFGELVPTDPGQPLNHVRALIAVRLAIALEHLGRLPEARATAARALAGLPGDDADRLDALMVTGDAARFDFDYPAAIAAYRPAIALAGGLNDRATLRNARVAAAYAESTLDPAAAAGELDRVLADGDGPGALARPERARIEDLRARAAINAGDTAAARQWSERALADSGGLTSRVDLAQIAIRYDAAIIASLRGDQESTREYLTYTGAGHLKSVNWAGAFEGELPVCSEEEGIRPADTVVVQFSIGDDGSVQGALPIYASRPGTLGMAFARAVSEWRWDAGSLRDVDAFWRNALVLQLRCTARPSPLSLAEPMRAEVRQWLAARGTDSSAEAVRAAADRHPSDRTVAMRVLLAGTSRSDQPATIARLAAVLDADGAPPAAYALLIDEEARLRSRRAFGVRDAAGARAGFLAQAVPPFRSRYPADPATAFLLLQWSLALEDSGQFAAARPLLQAALALPETALPAGSPVRAVAHLHAALVADRLGDAAEAGSAVAGLDAAQCALFDTHPVPASVALGSSTFPLEALRWRFEGFARESYDITADGHVANVRTVVAYPPFVFGPATERAVRAFRYVPPKIGSTAVGCAGSHQNVRYVLPH